MCSRQRYPAASFLKEGKTLSFREEGTEDGKLPDTALLQGYTATPGTARLANRAIAFMERAGEDDSGPYMDLFADMAGGVWYFSVLLCDIEGEATVNGAVREGRLQDLVVLRGESALPLLCTDGVLDPFGLIAAGLVWKYLQEHEGEERSEDRFTDLERSISNDAAVPEKDPLVLRTVLEVRESSLTAAFLVTDPEAGEERKITNLLVFLSKCGESADFTEESLPVYRFLVTLAAAEEETKGLQSYGVLLSGLPLDLFYAAMEGQEVEARDADGKEFRLTIGRQKVFVRLTTRSISDEDGNFTGVRLFGVRPLCMTGRGLTYALDGQNLTLLSPKEVQILHLFDPVMKPGSMAEIETEISPEKVRRFYEETIPALLQTGLVSLSDGAKSRVMRYLARGTNGEESLC